MKSPWMILGYVAALFGLSSFSDAPDASEGILEAPPATMPAFEYGEAPVEAQAATTTSSTTTVWIEPQPKSDCEIALQLALDVGWPADQMATLARVLWRESRCTPGAHNANDPGSGSYGYLQLNSFWCTPSSSWPVGWLQAKKIVTSCEDLYDPATNLRAGLAIWRNSSWHPWAIK